IAMPVVNAEIRIQMIARREDDQLIAVEMPIRWRSSPPVRPHRPSVPVGCPRRSWSAEDVVREGDGGGPLRARADRLLRLHLRGGDDDQILFWDRACHIVERGRDE